MRWRGGGGGEGGGSGGGVGDAWEGQGGRTWLGRGGGHCMSGGVLCTMRVQFLLISQPFLSGSLMMYMDATGLRYRPILL